MVKTEKNYKAHGLNISSLIPLNDLPSGNFPIDVEIRYGKITEEMIFGEFYDERILNFSGVKIHIAAQAMYFEWEKLGKVLVRNGKEVIVEPYEETLEADLQPFLIGPVLAVLLHQRGNFVLHASAVEIDGAGFAFLGAKGYGKSTLAGYLQSKGCRLISDDIVPVILRGAKAVTIPGFPRIKLYDDSIEAIGEIPTDFPTVHRFVEKRSLQIDEPFSTEPISLHGVYILDYGEKIGIEKINSTDAFIEVLKNTHLNRFLKDLNCQREYFEFCKKFVQRVPVFRLCHPHDFSKISEVGTKLKCHAAEFLDEKNFNSNNFQPNSVLSFAA